MRNSLKTNDCNGHKKIMSQRPFWKKYLHA